MSNTERNKRKKKNQQRNRAARIEQSDKTGWKQCTQYHYQKIINGKLVDWWPSRFKCMIDREVYRVFDSQDIGAITIIQKGN